MENVQESSKKFRFWKIVLIGHFEDIEQAIKAIEENQQEAWIGFYLEGDEEQTATINLRWVDIAMTRLVKSIVETDFPYVTIKSNWGVYENDDSVQNA